MQRAELKQKTSNIILGLAFGLLAMYLMPSSWAYVCFALSFFASVFSNDVINTFTLKAEIGKIKIIGGEITMTHRDKNGNIISKSK